MGRNDHAQLSDLAINDRTVNDLAILDWDRLARNDSTVLNRQRLPINNLAIIDPAVDNPAVLDWNRLAGNDPAVLDWNRLGGNDSAILDRILRLTNWNSGARIGRCDLRRLLVGGVRPQIDLLAQQTCAGRCEERNANQERKKSLGTELFRMIHFILTGKRKGKETEQPQLISTAANSIYGHNKTRVIEVVGLHPDLFVEVFGGCVAATKTEG